MEVPSVGGVG